VRISDKTATRVGLVTLCTVVAAPIAFIGAMLLSHEYPRLIKGWVFPAVLLGIAFLAWSIAHFAMIAHQQQSGSVSPADIEDWDRRQDTKLGGLVPFIYLLASPEQRRVLTYLAQERGSLPRFTHKDKE
jgi:hypothetical protein